MRPSHATINISNLRLRTFIGFNPEELDKKQDVVINIEIRYAISDAALEDHVHGALNYKSITKEVIRHVEQGSFLLLEKLVADVLEITNISANQMVHHLEELGLVNYTPYKGVDFTELGWQTAERLLRSRRRRGWRQMLEQRPGRDRLAGGRDLELDRRAGQLRTSPPLAGD